MTSAHRLGTSVLVTLVLSLAWRSPASAQSLTRGAVQGVVHDAAGAPLSGTSVVLRDLSTGTSRTVTTPRSGRFHFSLLLPGDYELFAERFGSAARRVRGISVQPGRRLELSVELHGPEGPRGAADTLGYDAARVAERGAAGGRHFSEAELQELPEENRELTGVGRLSSASGPGLEVQGLPAELSGVVVDGMPVTVARMPLAMGTPFNATHLALSGFQGAVLATSGVDVELPGRAGAVLSGYTRRGTRDVHVEGFATGGGGSPPPPGALGRAVGSQQELGGGVVVTGPLAADVASFSVGIEGWLVSSHSTPGALRDSLASEVAASTGAAALPDLAEPALRGGGLSGFGGVDWQIGAEHSVSARTNFSLLSHAPAAVGASPASWAETRFDGGQLSAGVEAISALGDRLTQSIRVGFELLDREYLPARRLPLDGAGNQTLAPTRIIGEDWIYTLASGSSGVLRQAVLRASETLNYDTDRHALKGGLAVSLDSYDYSFGQDRSGEFLFSGLDELARREGAFVQRPGGAAAFSVPRLSAYLQDEWRAGRGLELLAGVRYELEALPKNGVVPNPEWSVRSGVNPLAFRAALGQASPRVGFRWSPSQRSGWLVTGTLGLYPEPVDPALLAGLLASGTSSTVRRGVGALSSWPLLPDSSAAAVVGPGLTLLPSGFGGPRTVRASLGLARQLRPGTTVDLSLDYRRTDRLPRAHDLNLLPLPVAHDQHGRPVYGQLRLEGGLLLPETGSNRRFADFDQVLSTDVDGWSAFRGVTVAAEHRGASGVQLFASYTFSRTRDNWPGASLAPAELPAFPDSRGDGEWAKGRSDLDVPSRAVLTAIAPTPGLARLRLGLVYRYRSGYAFTPSFREGVDANGDGSDHNDPAFVDPDVPGADVLLAAWPCLRSASGRFAPRNACRGPGANTLDLRASFQVSRTRRYTLAVQADAMDLLGGERFALDSALYLVEGRGPLTTDPATGVVTLPLRANPHFGQSLRPAEGGRTLRLGLRLGY
jgi:hypothetical protein